MIYVHCVFFLHVSICNWPHQLAQFLVSFYIRFYFTLKTNDHKHFFIIMHCHLCTFYLRHPDSFANFLKLQLWAKLAEGTILHNLLWMTIHWKSEIFQKFLTLFAKNFLKYCLRSKFPFNMENCKYPAVDALKQSADTAPDHIFPILCTFIFP